MSLEYFLKITQSDIEATVAERPTFSQSDSIPEPLPLEIQKWVEIPNIAVAFVDLVGSSKIDFRSHKATSATIYELFTGTLVDTMWLMGADYIDVKGDGVFAIFTGQAACAKAFLATVSFRTACELYIKPLVKTRTNNAVNIMSRSGISFGDTIVKRIGRRGSNNEVWAYRTVNETAKLSSLAEPGRLVIGADAFNILSKSDAITYTCGCETNTTDDDIPRGAKSYVWNQLDSSRLGNSGIKEAYELRCLRWCKNHGAQYFKIIADAFGATFPRLEPPKSSSLNLRLSITPNSKS